MSELRVVVDHLRLNYTGPFDANALFKHINAFLFERGFDLLVNKEFEHNTKTGKQIEWQIIPWKRKKLRRIQKKKLKRKNKV